MGIEKIGVRPASREPLSGCIERGVGWLLEQQADEGHWCGELEADTTLEADYILYLRILGHEQKIEKLARYVRARQLADGGWNIYEGGSSELNATVKAWVGLRLAGDPADGARLKAARARIHALGGVERTNSFTRFYLAMVGAIDWRLVPAVPPELTIAPSWCPLNVYNMSAWTRAIVVPLTIIYALRPRRLVLDGFSVDELFVDPSQRTAERWDSAVVTWRNAFLGFDRLLKWYERAPIPGVRRRALDVACGWMIEHFERSDGLAAIYPAMLNAVFALLATGRSLDDPLTARAVDALAALEIEEPDSLRVQPTVSPVWDTALAMVALRQAGVRPDHPALIRAADWLLRQQIAGPGDWQVNNPDLEPGGWAFQFNNGFYPDVDDTAFVLMALRGVAHPDPLRLADATKRGTRWLVGMQNHDGGWGAFDRANDHAVLTSVPFADHNAMIDPSTADVTARVLECLAHFGWRAEAPEVARGLEYLRREQTSDGAWYGRWGVNYIYGTSGVLRAARALGVADLDWCTRGAGWLAGVQNDDGGFGETCESYDDPALKGCGPSTASQTAWAVIGLLAAGPPSQEPVRRGVWYLAESQGPNGSWRERAATGTGFPRNFYLNYGLYCHVFPLYALGRYRVLAREEAEARVASQSAIA